MILTHTDVVLDLQTDSGEAYPRTIRVRALPLHLLPEYFTKLENATELLVLTTSLTVDEVNALPAQATQLLLDAAGELNDPFLQAWVERQAKVKERFTAVTARFADGPSPTPSPTSSSAVPPRRLPQPAS